ncbi:hypothetical protein TrispH2_011156 [Trichoplax sp. H2]|nr:hypothetical protein TrispH2_011156 [Trichoplax sp. H2]|eukprot:RDD36477.1 hypothetical protein TrispH2_011156 [Trichoplax sp. H2]
MASNSFSSTERTNGDSMPMPTTFDTCLSGFSDEANRMPNRNDSFNSISSPRQFDYRNRNVMYPLQHRGSSESSLASVPSSYSHASTNDPGLIFERMPDNFYEPTNRPPNFNSYPYGERDGIYGSGLLDSGLSQTRSEHSMPESERLQRHIDYLTSKVKQYQIENKHYQEENVLLAARLKATLDMNAVLQRKLKEYAASRWAAPRQQWSSDNTIPTASAYPVQGMAHTTRSAFSPTLPSVNVVTQKTKTTSPHPRYMPPSSYSPNQETSTEYNNNNNTNKITSNNSHQTASPGLIERKEFRNINSSQLEFLKDEHLSTLDSKISIASERSKSITERDWSGFSFKGGAVSLISLLSEGTGVHCPSLGHSEHNSDLSDSDSDESCNEENDEQSILSRYNSINLKKKLPWKFVVRSEICYQKKGQLCITLMDAECNLPKLPRLKVYFFVNLTSNNGDWSEGRKTELFHVTKKFPINQVYNFSLINDSLDDFVINLSVCTRIEPSDVEVSLGIQSIIPPNCLNGVRSYEITSSNAKTWKQVISSLKNCSKKSSDITPSIKQNNDNEEGANSFRHSIPIKTKDLDKDASNPSSYISCNDEEIILQNRTHSYSNLRHVGVEESDHNDSDDECNEITPKLESKAPSRTSINGSQNIKEVVETESKDAASSHVSKSKDTTTTAENHRGSRRSLKSLLRRNHKRKNVDTMV